MRQAAGIRGVLAGAFSVLLLSPAAEAPAAVQCEEARFERSLGVAQVLERCGRIAGAGSAESAARRGLGRLAPALGLRRDGRDLGLLRTDVHPAGRAVRFRQLVDGVPVRFAQVVVLLGPHGSVDWVASGAVPADEPLVDPACDNRGRSAVDRRGPRAGGGR